MSRIPAGTGARLFRHLAQARQPLTRAAAPSTRLGVGSEAVARPLCLATTASRILASPRHFTISARALRHDAAAAGSGGGAIVPQAQEDGGAEGDGPAGQTQSQALGEIKPRLSLTFTCTASGCGHRSTHEFSKQAYTRGIVIVQCPGCQNRHLIADHLGWFTETADEPKTVEEMVAAKGGQVKRGFKYSDGKGGQAIEIEPNEDAPASRVPQ